MMHIAYSSYIRKVYKLSLLFSLLFSFNLLFGLIYVFGLPPILTVMHHALHILDAPAQTLAYPYPHKLSTPTHASTHHTHVYIYVKFRHDIKCQEISSD